MNRAFDAEQLRKNPNYRVGVIIQFNDLPKEVKSQTELRSHRHYVMIINPIALNKPVTLPVWFTIKSL